MRTTNIILASRVACSIYQDILEMFEFISNSHIINQRRRNCTFFLKNANIGIICSNVGVS